ncbi:hypothetical protein TRVL_08848 [Trypanosoma vivax]|nr:hypothetical protein TRVL_08848 [Trypanosoma vivax]
MAFRFSLALLAAILLNGAVLGDDSTSSGALAGADGERNAPSRGGEAGCKSEGRARNGDKLVVLDSAPTTPSETMRKSVSVARRMSRQSSLSSRNEARNDHVGVGSELPDQPATSHKAQPSADDKHGMKLPRARRPAASRHSEGSLTSTSLKESAEALDRKEFENMVNGIIAEEAAEAGVYGGSDSYPVIERGEYPKYPYDQESSAGGNGESGPVVSSGGSSSVNSTSNSGPAPDSNPSATSSSGSGQSSVTVSGVESNTNNGNSTKHEQEKEKEKQKEKDGKEKEEKQVGEQRSGENSDGLETNNSSEDTNSEKVPSAGNSPFLCGSYSSVLLVALTCFCARAC